MPSSIKVNEGTRSETSNQTLVADIEPSTALSSKGNLPSGKEIASCGAHARNKRSRRLGYPSEMATILCSHPQEVYSDGRTMTLLALGQPDFYFSVWPSLASTQGSSLRVETQPDDGIFKSYRAMGIPRTILASWTPEQSVKSMPISLSDPATVPTAEEIEAAPRWRFVCPRMPLSG